MKYLHRVTRPRRRAGVSVAMLTVLSCVLLACADEEVRTLGAQNAEAVGAEEIPPEPTIPPEDTLTRTAGEAIAMTLAAAEAARAAEAAEARADSIAAAQADTSSVPDSVPALDSIAQTPPAPPPPPVRYDAGEDPAFAARYGWPVTGPIPLPGAILPANRIVCYYGNPNSTRMGALGQYPKEEMLGRLHEEVVAWEEADPDTPVEPCLHMIAVVAQADAGTSGHYRSIMRDTTVRMVHEWAREIDGIFIVDLQAGTDDIRDLLPRFEWILKEPDVHLAIDPEFYMSEGGQPGRRIGSLDAADINYASDFLATLVREYDLPPKVLIVHRFTQGMVTNSPNILLRPEVQIVMHMDGWGAPWLKRDSYRDFIVREPVQYTGFKLFYGNDTKTGTELMQPEDLLQLRPTPVYIQYQ